MLKPDISSYIKGNPPKDSMNYEAYPILVHQPPSSQEKKINNILLNFWVRLSAFGMSQKS